MKKKWTGERLEAFIYNRDTIDHLHRYALAGQYIQDKVVLDVACGEGYGSHLMSQKAQQVFAVDIDAQTIAQAQKKYASNNIDFLVGSAADIPLEAHSVDVVVSFETIEHHDQHEQMMAEIKRVLKPGGLVIISTPDKLYYTDQRNFQNPFHVKELYKDEFTALFAPFFKITQLLTQTYCGGNSIIQDDQNLHPIEFFTGDYQRISPQKLVPLYLIMLASESAFTLQKTTIFNGENIVKKEISEQVRQSITYRIGQWILTPVKWLKK